MLGRILQSDREEINFLTLYINRHSGLYFYKPRFIIDYECAFEGQLFVA
jgi:hypothetical protein